MNPLESLRFWRAIFESQWITLVAWQCSTFRSEESAGKSTILEMLAMLPFFPRKRRCCTRLAIHLRLRRTPGISRATLTVLSAEGEEELSRDIPQENGWLIVQALSSDCRISSAVTEHLETHCVDNKLIDC